MAKANSSARSPFKPVSFSSGRGHGLFVSIDVQKRLMLSSDVRKKLGISDLMSPWIAVFYDKETHRIAIQKEELVKVAPVEAKTKVDKRGYFNAKSVLEAAAIDDSRLPLRYYYDGDVSIEGERFLSFKLRAN